VERNVDHVGQESAFHSLHLTCFSKFWVGNYMLRLHSLNRLQVLK
jgi:hypothetical protein